MTLSYSEIKSERVSLKSIWIFILGLLIVDQLTVRLSAFQISDFMSWRYWANQLASGFFIYGLAALLGGYLSNLRAQGKTRLVVFLLIVNALEFVVLITIQVNHFLIYQKPFGSFAVRFVLENPQLVLELMRDNVNPVQSILRVLPAVTPLILLLIWCTRSAAPSPLVRTTGVLSFLASLGLATFAWASAPTMQHSLLSASVAFTDLLRMPDNFYKTEVPGRKHFGKLNCSGVPQGPQRASVIWIIGESLVASRMSLYGYSRSTTEFLLQEWQADRLVRFNNAVSIGTVTRVSVPYLFFGLQGPDKNGRLYRSPSIFDYAKASGLQTAFIGAQELRWGNQDKIIINNSVDLYKSGTDFDRNAGVSKGAEDFKVLNEGAIPFLKNAKAPFFLALHMDGSHYPYSLHSLPEYKKYLPELSPNDDNAYDNTVVQLDAYIQRVLEVVRSYHPNAWVFYSSDHGQNLGEQTRFNSGYSENVIRNPLFAFPPNSLGDALEQNTGAPVSQADLFATTLALWGCEAHPGVKQDSYSLFGAIPANRLRAVAGYMSSHLADETVSVLLPDRQRFEIDYAKGAVTLPDERVIPLSSWQSPVKIFLERAEHRSENF